jgi:hypothetical protein
MKVILTLFIAFPAINLTLPIFGLKAAIIVAVSIFVIMIPFKVLTYSADNMNAFVNKRARQLSIFIWMPLFTEFLMRNLNGAAIYASFMLAEAFLINWMISNVGTKTEREWGVFWMKLIGVFVAGLVGMILMLKLMPLYDPSLKNHGAIALAIIGHVFFTVLTISCGAISILQLKLHRDDLLNSGNNEAEDTPFSMKIKKARYDSVS